MKRKLLALVLMAVMVFSLAACSKTASQSQNSTPAGSGNEAAAGNSQEPVTLRIYAQYSDEDTKQPLDYAIAELKKEMPWVTLEIDVQAQDDGQKLKTYAATGDMPDIFNCGLNLIDTFIKSGNIAVLNDYLSVTGYDTAIQDSCKDLLYHPDGNVYAFPYAGNEIVLVYFNKELFEKQGLEAPKTFEDLMAAAEKFNAAGITPMSIFAQEGWVTVAMYDSIATKYVPEGIKGLDNGKTSISDEGYLKAAQKLQEMVQANVFAKGATGLNYDQAASLFYQDQAAMFINGQWFITDADTNMPGKVDWTYFPVTADGGTNANAVSGSGNIGGYAVSSSTPDKELAAKVAAFVAMKSAEYKYTERANTIVAVKVDKPFNCEVSPMIEKLSTELPNMTIDSTFAWGLSNAKLKTTLEEQTQALIAGTITPEDFIKTVEKSIN